MVEVTAASSTRTGDKRRQEETAEIDLEGVDYDATDGLLYQTGLGRVDHAEVEGVNVDNDEGLEARIDSYTGGQLEIRLFTTADSGSEVADATTLSAGDTVRVRAVRA